MKIKLLIVLIWVCSCGAFAQSIPWVRTPMDTSYAAIAKHANNIKKNSKCDFHGELNRLKEVAKMKHNAQKA